MLAQRWLHVSAQRLCMCIYDDFFFNMIYANERVPLDTLCVCRLTDLKHDEYIMVECEASKAEAIRCFRRHFS